MMLNNTHLAVFEDSSCIVGINLKRRKNINSDITGLDLLSLSLGINTLSLKLLTIDRSKLLIDNRLSLRIHKETHRLASILVPADVPVTLTTHSCPKHSLF